MQHTLVEATDAAFVSQGIQADYASHAIITTNVVIRQHTYVPHLNAQSQAWQRSVAAPSVHASLPPSRQPWKCLKIVHSVKCHLIILLILLCILPRAKACDQLK